MLMLMLKLMSSLRRFALFANLLALMIAAAYVPTAVHAANHAPREPWTTSAVMGSPTPPSPYKIEPAFPHLSFSNPTSILEIPNSNRLLVSEMSGKIFSFLKDATVTKPTLVTDLSVVSGGRVSLYDVTLHPNFATNRFLFVCHGHSDGKVRVSRHKVHVSPELGLVPGSEKVLLKWPAGGHGGGCLEFGPDGFLYISTGDASGPAPPDKRTTGQDVSDLLGSVLRIDVNTSDGDRPYLIPESNPFIDRDGIRPEIWSYGLRNPWKFGIDRFSGDVFVADKRMGNVGDDSQAARRKQLRLADHGRSGTTSDRGETRTDADHSPCEGSSAHGGEFGNWRTGVSWLRISRTGRPFRIRGLHNWNDLEPHDFGRVRP